MGNKVIYAAFEDADIQQINEQLAAIQQQAIALIQANTRLRDRLAAAIVRHEQISAEMAGSEELSNDN